MASPCPGKYLAGDSAGRRERYSLARSYRVAAHRCTTAAADAVSHFIGRRTGGPNTNL